MIQVISKINIKARVLIPFLLLAVLLLQCNSNEVDTVEAIRKKLAEKREQCLTSEEMTLIQTMTTRSDLDFSSERGLLIRLIYQLGNHLNQIQRQTLQECLLSTLGYTTNCQVMIAEIANLAIDGGHVCQNSISTPIESHNDDAPPINPGPGPNPTPPGNPGPGPNPTPPGNPGPGPNPTPPINPGPGPNPTPPINPAPGPNPTPPINPGPGPNPTPPINPAPGPNPTPPINPGPGPNPTPPINPGPGPNPTPPINPGPGPNPTPPINPGPGPNPTPPINPGPGPNPTPPGNPGPGPNPTPPGNPGPGPNPTPPINPGPGPNPTPPINPGPGPNPTPPGNPGPGPNPTPPINPGPGPSPTPPGNPGPGPNPTPPINPGPGPNPTPPINPGPGPNPTPPGNPGPGPNPTPPINPGPGPSPTPINHLINNFNPRTTPGGGYIPILSPTPPTSSPAPGGGSAISLPSGNVVIPSDPAQRRQLLENSYEDVEIPANVDPGPAVPVSPRVSPDTLDASATPYQTFRYLLDPELRLTTSGNIPYLKPLEPDVYTHETNSYNDPAFSSLSTWKKNYWYARFNSGTNGHVLYLLDYTYGRTRIGNLASTDSKVYIKQDELYIGYPYTDQQNRNQANNLFDSTKLIDISALNLPIRRINTVTIANPLPTLASSSVSPCNKSVTGKGTRVAPFKIYNFKQFNDYLRRYLTSYFTIECDIDASSSRSQNNGAGFEPIRYFAGFVNGNGHKIVGLYINRPDEHQVGLFAQLLGSKIENLTITNAHVTGKYQVGILAGHMVRSLVDSVKATGHVQGVGETGGLIGFQTSHFFAYTHGIVYYKYNTVRLFIPYRTAEIKNSHVKILVNCVRGAEDRKFHRMCGGLVGWMGSGFINSSSASGNVVMSEAPVGNGVAVKIDGDMAGGLVGVIGTRTNDGGALLIEADGPFAGADVFRQARVYRSYSTVNIYAGITIGGLVGAALRGGVVIAESYAKNFHLEGESMLAGLVATLEGSYLVNCYAVNGTIYSHSEDPNDPIFTKIYASPSVYSFIGFSDSIFTNPASETLAITYQRVYARYLVSSRFKIGVANTYADVQVNNTSVTKRGLAIPFIRNVAGSYYKLDGSSIHVIGTVLDNHVRGRFPRNASNVGGSFLYSAYKPPYLNIADFWSGGKFVSTRAGDPSYDWRNNGIDSRHLATHSSRKRTLECPTAPNASCLGKTSTYVNWPASGVWNFGTNRELPTLVSVVPTPRLN